MPRDTNLPAADAEPAKKPTKRETYEAAASAAKGFGAAHAKLHAFVIAGRALGLPEFRLLCKLTEISGNSHAGTVDLINLSTELGIHIRRLENLLSELRHHGCLITFRSEKGTAFTFPIPGSFLTHLRANLEPAALHVSACNSNETHADTCKPGEQSAFCTQIREKSDPPLYSTAFHSTLTPTDEDKLQRRHPDQLPPSQSIPASHRPLSDLRALNLVVDECVTVSKAKIAATIAQKLPKPPFTFCADVSLIQQISTDTGVSLIDAAQRLANVLGAWHDEGKRHTARWRIELGDRARREIASDLRAKNDVVATEQSDLFPEAQSWLVVSRAGLRMRLPYQTRTGDQGEVVRFLPRLAISRLADEQELSIREAAQLILGVVEGWKARYFCGKRESWEQDLLDEARALHWKTSTPPPPPVPEGIEPTRVIYGPLPPNLIPGTPEYEEGL